MELYYGSNVEVSKPSLKFSRYSRDFGKGFYLTTDYEQARDWALKKTIKVGKGEATVSVFEVPDDFLKTLHSFVFDAPNKDWFLYVVMNRNYEGSMNDNDYDVVVGPIANDGTYETINLYLREVISEDVAIDALKTYKLKNQYAFKSEKALSMLSYKGVR